MLKRIFVCSEFGGLDINAAYAAQYCLYIVRHGSNPFAPHVFYPLFLNDGVKEDRDMGIRCGIDWMSASDEVAVFVRRGKIMNGMRQEIATAIESKIPVRYFDATAFDLAHVCFDAIVPLPHLASDKLPTESELLSAATFAATAKRSLENVAKALKKGVKYEDLQGEVDRLLGDSEQPRDEVLEARWEEDYRTSRS